MIRRMTSEDIETVGAIWLEASIRAHHFVPETFWRSDYKTMVTEILPDPRNEGWVHVDPASGAVDGFATLRGDTVNCLFVRPDRQRSGVGSALLEHIQERHLSLELKVYAQNVDATRLYEARGFRVNGKSTCPYTGCAELCMAWCESGGDSQ